MSRQLIWNIYRAIMEYTESLKLIKKNSDLSIYILTFYYVITRTKD